MTISIIIPTLNEAENIQRLIEFFKKNDDGQLRELIVTDGGSTDGTPQIAAAAGAKVFSCIKGRACQMNKGAENAKGDILYFVHADSIPPESFMDDLNNAFTEGFPIGCFRFKFNSPKKILKFNSFMTRFDKIFCRGGDQTLYVTRDVFDELQGYRDDFQIMEEYDFIIRARKKYPFKIIPKDVLVSARKYDERSWLRVMMSNSIVFTMFRNGASQNAMVDMYKRLLG